MTSARSRRWGRMEAGGWLNSLRPNRRNFRVPTRKRSGPQAVLGDSEEAQSSTCALRKLVAFSGQLMA